MPPRPPHLVLPRGRPPGPGSRAGRRGAVRPPGSPAPAAPVGRQAERDRRRPVQLFPPFGAGCGAAEPSGPAGPGGPPAAAGAEPRGRRSFSPRGRGRPGSAASWSGKAGGAPCRGRGPATAGLPGSPGPAVRRGEPVWCRRPAGVPGAAEGVPVGSAEATAAGESGRRVLQPAGPRVSAEGGPGGSATVPGPGSAVSAQPCPAGGGAAPTEGGRGAGT